MKLVDSELKNAKSVAIAGHIKPDGDCVGALLALFHYLKNKYKMLEVTMFLENVPHVFSIFEETCLIKNEAPKDVCFDVFFCLDCSDEARLGKFGAAFDGAKLKVVIDHHISNLEFGDVNEVLPEKSATCEVLYELLDEDGIDVNVAEALYLGIAHDTGGFKFPNVSKRTMEIAGNLISYGIPFTKIIDETLSQRTWTQNRLMGYALESSRLYLDGQLVISYIDADTLSQYQAKIEDTEGIVEQLRLTKGTRAAVLFYEVAPGNFKVSMRTSDETDVSVISVKYGGGGHEKAAGCNLFMTPEEIIRLMVEEFQSAWDARK